MARTTQEIEKSIISEKDNNPILAPLNSPSQTAVWRSLVRLFAAAANVLEQFWDVFKAEILTIIEQNRVGTTSWYAARAREFQLGDVLNENGEYDVIDATKRIITRVSVNQSTTGIIVKIAKNNPPGPLSAIELAAFQGYFEAIKFAGVATSYISISADQLRVNFEIFYKPDATEQDAENQAIEAINEYCELLDFDGLFIINDLLARIRTKPAIFNVDVNTIQYFQNATATSIDAQYRPVAGYIVLDLNNSNFTLTQAP